MAQQNTQSSTNRENKHHHYQNRSQSTLQLMNHRTEQKRGQTSYTNSGKAQFSGLKLGDPLSEHHAAISLPRTEYPSHSTRGNKKYPKLCAFTTGQHFEAVCEFLEIIASTVFLKSGGSTGRSRRFLREVGQHAYRAEHCHCQLNVEVNVQSVKIGDEQRPDHERQAGAQPGRREYDCC